MTHMYGLPVPTFAGSDATVLHYDVLPEESDAGPTPIIVLAGGAARHPSYLGDLAGLGQQHRLVVPHLRGVGNSPAPAAKELGSYWRQAEDVDRLRVHLGLERALLVGHSAGTRLAIAYAAQFPDRLAGMVLITPPAGYLVAEPSDADVLMDRRRGGPAFDAAAAAFTTGPDIASDDAFNAWHQRTAPVGYAVWGEAEQAHARVGQWSLAAASAYFSVEPPRDFADRVGKVTAPVLTIAGAEDCLTGLAPVVALSKLFPAGRIAVIEHCGHYPWVEQPTAFRQAIDAFLSDDRGPLGAL